MVTKSGWEFRHLKVLPRFDAHWLWQYRDIRFSGFGNLTQTVIQLVHRASGGLRASELEDLLGLQPRSFLSLFRHHLVLKREVHEGRFVYFAADANRYRQQAARLMISSTLECPTAP